jgi:hypothetical protein
VDNFDANLNNRITELESHIPIPAQPPRLRESRTRILGRSVTLAPLLALAVVATAAGSVVIVSTLVRGYPGIEDPGQPLAGAHLECMSPIEAAAFLADHGFNDVTWQVESGDPASRTTSSVQASAAPAHGYVVPGSILSDGRLHMVVDQRVGATGVGDCFSRPMP